MNNPLTPDELKREFNELASGGFPWSMSAIGLSGAADLLWEASSKGSETWHRLYRVDSDTGKVSLSGERFDPDDFRVMAAIEYARIALMLLGMALEGEAKAVLVSRDPSLVDQAAGKIAPTLATHDLAQLVTRCGVPLTEAQRATLHVVTEYVKWAGRYPVPTRAVHGMSTLPEGGWSLNRLGAMTKHWALLRPLVEEFGDLADRERPV